MAPTFQATGIQVSSTGASVNVSWPTHVANDIGLVIIETSGNSATLTPPAGWTALPSTPVTDVATAAGSNLHVWWKRAASSSEAVVATGATTDHILALLVTFRGCATTGNPWDVTTTGIKTTASIVATVPALTTTVDDTLITMIVGRPNDTSSTTQFGIPVNLNLTSIAEQDEAGTTFGNGGGFVVSTGIKALAGNTGTSTLTKAASTTDTYVVLALKAGAATIYELITTVGSFALSGTTTGLLKSSRIDTTVSAFDFTGNNLILSSSVNLNVTVGSFAFAGNNLILSPTVALNTTVGAFNLTGNSADLTYTPAVGLELICQLGSFTLTGINLNSAFTYAIIGSKGSFLIGFKPADVAKNFQLISSTGTYTLTGISSDAVKNYPIVALPQSYLVGTTGIDYFSTRRLEALNAPFVMRLQSNGDFFWYQTTQTIPIIKPRLTNRNQWILGRATHMGRRGL